jgi:hypothetical protein
MLAGLSGLAFLYLLSSRLAHAEVINIIDANGVSWDVSFSAPIDLSFVATTPAPGNRMTVGVLADNTIRTTLAPLTIHFIQNTEAPTEADVTRGLRILFQTHIVNNTGVDWIGFRLELVDNSYPAGTPANSVFDDVAHPPEAHFHARGGATYFPFNGFAPPGSPSGCPKPVGADVSCNMLVTDGTNVVEAVGENNFLQIQNLLLHEREFSPAELAPFNDPGRRFFDLVLTPVAVPEPGLISLIGSGLLVLGLMAKRYHFL